MGYQVIGVSSRFWGFSGLYHQFINWVHLLGEKFLVGEKSLAWREKFRHGEKFFCLSKTLKFSLFFKQWIFLGSKSLSFQVLTKRRLWIDRSKFSLSKNAEQSIIYFFPTVAQWEGSLLQKCCQKECPVLQQLLQKIVEKWWMIKEQLNRWVRKTWEKNLFVSKGT